MYEVIYGLLLNSAAPAVQSSAYQLMLDRRVGKYELPEVGYCGACISYKNEHLFTFDAKKEHKSFAIPRSWEYVGSILQSSLDASLLLETISGAVGCDVAVSFLSFLKVMDRLPDIEKILSADDFSYSEEVDVLYALSSGIVSYYLQNPSQERM